MAEEKGVVERIRKDMRMFDGSIAAVEGMLEEERGREGNVGEPKLRRMKNIIELAKMYRSDSESFLGKGDTDTSFSCISYAHGLLDSLRELLKGDVFENREWKEEEQQG